METDVFPPKDVIERLMFRGKNVIGGVYNIDSGKHRVPMITERIEMKKNYAFADSKIAFLGTRLWSAVEGGERVDSLTLKRLTDGTIHILPVAAVFIYVGLRPNTSWLANRLPLTADGFIETNDHMATSLPGVFAAGDVRKKLLRQIATAVGDGSTAAFAVEKYLQSR